MREKGESEERTAGEEFDNVDHLSDEDVGEELEENDGEDEALQERVMSCVDFSWVSTSDGGRKAKRRGRKNAQVTASERRDTTTLLARRPSSVSDPCQHEDS
jgi:hypothetical protein